MLLGKSNVVMCLIGSGFWRGISVLCKSWCVAVIWVYGNVLPRIFKVGANLL